jgi:hypothetical protein
MIKNEGDNMGRVKGYGCHQLGKGRDMKRKPKKHNTKRENELT